MSTSVTQIQRPVPELIKRILMKRGMSAGMLEEFLYPDYDNHLHDPYLLSDMERAVARIAEAVASRQQVVVYGDYDIDGLTASAVLIEMLGFLGLEARSYIPDRFKEGYGINTGALEKLQAEGADLVISVDCGITSVREAEWAKQHNLDLIITDHHAVPAVLPDAIAVINPKRLGDAYPFKELCGAGVAFKLAQALQQHLHMPAHGQEKWLLDLVALGTVCDVVELTGENRVLVCYGLKVLRRTRRPGLRALAHVGGVDIAQILSQHLGFVMGPRMNAAGRLEHASQSLELLMTTDSDRAMAIAEQLDVLNRERRDTQDQIFEAAMAMAEQYADDPVLVLADETWSHGIVGIVASKLVERWEKPVLVAQVMGQFTKGSARSTGTFNMVEALRAQADLFSKFGGHFYAAGYTLPTDRLDELRRGLCDYYRETAAITTAPALVADVTLPDLSEVSWPLYDMLELLQPYGASHPEPLFEMTGLRVASVKPMGQGGQHLRLELCDSAGCVITAVGFNIARKYPDASPGKMIRLYGQLNKNEFRGSRSLQVVVSGIEYE